MSSNKRGRSLADVVSTIDDDISVEVQPATPAVAAPASPGEVAAPVAIVPINILVTPHDRKRLRQLSLDTGLSLQKLGHEAWNQLLETRGLPPLEPLAANVPSGRARRQAP